MPPVKRDDRDDVPESAEYLHWQIPEPRLAWLEEQNAVAEPRARRTSRASASWTRRSAACSMRWTPAAAQTTRSSCLWSDHGWHLGEKGITGKALALGALHARAADHRRTRRDARREGDQPGRAARHLPDARRALRPPTARGLEGHSLVPQLKDPSAPRAVPRHHHTRPNNHAVRSERFRYIRYFDGSEELYDHANDPNEWTNLAADPRTRRDKAAARRVPADGERTTDSRAA